MHQLIFFIYNLIQRVIMFKEFFQVRDNEVDIQGVVNNANYFIYFAHARHTYLQTIGINFAEMALQNQLLFLTSSNIEFKKPLKPNDKFYVTCKIVLEGKVRIGFEQEVRLIDTDELMVKALNIGVCINGATKRPYIPDAIKILAEDSVIES